MAVDQFGSGGGFSVYFNQASAKWQSAAAANYLATTTRGPKFPPAGSYPPQGRATPDLSALGQDYQVFLNGVVNGIGGTSASTPAFAGLVSLLNEARLAADMPPMGFLNPWLYAHPNMFRDVTEGNNAIGRNSRPTTYGWNCTVSRE